MIEPGNNEFTNQDDLTGSDLPHSDGVVSDEDVHNITDDQSDQPTGQDHSTDVDGEGLPDHGVGAVQDYSDTTSDVADLGD